MGLALLALRPALADLAVRPLRYRLSRRSRLADPVGLVVLGVRSDAGHWQLHQRLFGLRTKPGPENDRRLRMGLEVLERQCRPSDQPNLAGPVRLAALERQPDRPRLRRL